MLSFLAYLPPIDILMIVNTKTIMSDFDRISFIISLLKCTKMQNKLQMTVIESNLLVQFNKIKELRQTIANGKQINFPYRYITNTRCVNR